MTIKEKILNHIKKGLAIILIIITIGFAALSKKVISLIKKEVK